MTTLYLDVLAHRIRTGEDPAVVLNSILDLVIDDAPWVPVAWVHGLGDSGTIGAAVNDPTDPAVLLDESLRGDPTLIARTLVHEAGHVVTTLADLWDDVTDEGHGRWFGAACHMLAEALGLQSPPDGTGLRTWPMSL